MARCANYGTITHTTPLRIAMTSSESPKDYEAVLRSAMKESATVEENLQAIYAKLCSIVGPPQTDDEGNLTCQNCNEKYKEEENDDHTCTWYSDVHKGLFRTDYNSEAWYGWHEANPPKESAYWKRDGYVGEGYHKWTGCGCTQGNNGECEREDRHRSEGYPPASDDWVMEESAELSDDEYDYEDSKKSGQDLLVSNYIRQLNYLVQQKMEKSKGS